MTNMGGSALSAMRIPVEVPTEQTGDFRAQVVVLFIDPFSGPTPRRPEAGVDLLDRITGYVLANLGDPTLSVGSVARRHGISPRYLHQLFRRRDRSFAAWVRHERLVRVRRDLLDPALTRRTAAAIAARWGLPDAGHLSRAFRAEFGCTIREFRARRGHVPAQSTGAGPAT